MKLIEDKNILEMYLDEFEIRENFSTNLDNYFKLFSFDSGELVTSLDEYIDHFYFLVDGKLRIIMEEENGKQLLLRFYNPLSMIGDLGFIENYPVKTNVEVLCPSLLIGLEMKLLQEKAGDDPMFLKLIIKHLGHKLYTASNTASKNQLYPLENRFASYFFSINFRNDVKIEELKSFSLQETAMFLGTTYRHLNRVVKQLVEQGVVDKRNGRIVIINVKKLKELGRGISYE